MRKNLSHCFVVLLCLGPILVVTGQILSLTDQTGKLTSRDATYSYVDTLTNDCLHKIDTCDNGEILIFNVTVDYGTAATSDKSDTSSAFGRTVLYSSGGDSCYTPGGVFLHQYAVRGDSYVELGFTYRSQVFSTKLYLSDQSTSRLALVWTKNETSVKIYENGNLIGPLQSRPRNYYDLNYNPIRQAKFYNASVSATKLNKIFFNDSGNSEKTLMDTIKGTSDSYLLGCYSPKSSNIVQNQLQDDATTSTNEQCKKICLGNLQQIYMIKQLLCICAANRTYLEGFFTKGSCDSSWQTFIASNLQFNLMNANKLDLRVEQQLINERVEVNDPVGVKISSSSFENFVTQADFGDSGEIKSCVGSCFLVSQYSTPGLKTISVQARSLSNPNRKFQTKITVNVSQSADRLPMDSIELNYTKVSDKTVQVILAASGGLPYSCDLTFGDSSSKNLLSTDRISTWTLSQAYAKNGLYNLSAVCTSKSDSTSSVAKWTLVYLPVSQNLIVKQIFASRVNPSQNLDIQLPIDYISPQIGLKLVDSLNADNTFEWKPPTGTLLKLDYSNLKNKIDNYFQITTSTGLILASYLVTLEDKPTAPTINLVSPTPLNMGDLVKLEIVIAWMSGLLKVDFGDGQSSVYSIVPQSGDSQTTTYKLAISHAYDSNRQQAFTLQVALANHLGIQTATLPIKFESSLPRFTLTSSGDVSNIGQTVSFKLESTPSSNPAAKVPLCVVYFDYPNNPSLTKTFTDLTFASDNSNPLKFDFTYTYFGNFNVLVNCSNAIGFVLANTNVKVGTKLTTASGLLRNVYAHVNEPVNVVVRVDGTGNGYSMVANFGDSSSMLLPWAYLNSKGVDGVNAQTGYVAPKATFGNDGVTIIYAYKTPGKYQITVNVSNPFGSVVVSFCSQVIIKPNANNTVYSDRSCQLAPSNLGLSLNDQAIEKNSFDFSKGLSNKFSVDFTSTSCFNSNDTTTSQRPSLISYWVINRVDAANRWEQPIDRYCLVASSSNQFVIAPNDLTFGTYVLTAYAIDAANEQNFVAFANYQMNIVSSALVASLNQGVTFMELNWEEKLSLNFFSGSYDPDRTDRNDKTGLAFYLMCSETIALANQVRADMMALRLSSVDQKMNLVYEQTGFLYFYESNCFFTNYTTTSANNPINYEATSKIVQINADKMNINSTFGGLSLDLYVVKSDDGRVSASQRLEVSLNLSSVLKISVDTDVKEMGRQLDKLDDFAKKNPAKALTLLTSFVDVINLKADNVAEQINNQTTTTTTTTTTRAPLINKTEVNNDFSNLRGKVLNTLGTIVERVDGPTAIATAANATASITSNSEQMPTSNQASGSMAMQMMGEKAKEFVDVESEVVLGLTKTLLGAGSNMLFAASNTVPVYEEDRTDPELLVPQNETVEEPVPSRLEAPQNLYDQDSEDFPEDLYDKELEAKAANEAKEQALRVETGEITRRTMKSITDTATAIAANPNVVNETSNQTKLESKGLSLVVSAQNLSDASNAAPKQFAGSDSDGGASLVMPALSKVLDPGAATGGGVQTKMLVADSNPLQSTSGSQASGPILSFEISDKSGNPLKINNTAEPFRMFIPCNKPPRAFVAQLDPIGFTYFKLYLSTNESSLFFVLRDDYPGNYYHVYIKYSETKVTTEYPTETNSDYQYTLPNNRTLDNSQTRDLQHTVFMPGNATKGNGTYYIGVKLAKISDKLLDYLNKTNTSLSLIKIRALVRMFSTSCKYWDVATNSWLTKGCRVGENTVYNSTECLCNHLTTFGTDFYVPPNTIDFANVWAKFGKLNENAAVFATVISLLGVYVIVAILVRFLDKRDLVRWGATPLADNLPSDSYYYLISVQTGVGKDTSTTSKIGFVLAGEIADSGVRRLTDDKRRAFKSGSVCNFVMSVDEPLGPLTYLRVWHDNSGKGSSKSWYLNMVSVVDLQTHEKSNFVCNNWLAVEKGDGQVDRLLPVASENDLVSFKHLFTQSIKKKFNDSHLWVSVVSRPTRSAFTRLQRVSCCMSLLFCTMIANAMFYRADSNVATKSGVIQLGPIKFTMTQLYTSIMSTLIVLPVNLLIVTLFRKAKLKRNLNKSKKTGHVAKKKFWRRVRAVETINLPEQPTNNPNRLHVGTTNNNLWTPTSSFIVSDSCARFERSEVNIGIDQKHTSVFKKLCCCCFKSSDEGGEYRRETGEELRNRKQGRTLPHWTIYIAWSLVFVSILVPAFFVILYSMEWGRDRSNAWLLSMFMSFFQSLFIVDPLKVFLLTALIACILKKVEDADSSSSDDDELLVDSGDPLYNAILNKDEEYLHERLTTGLSQVDIREIERSRRTKLVDLRPLDPDVLEQQREKRVKDVKMAEIIKEMISYAVFLCIVLFLAYQSRPMNGYRMQKDLVLTFLKNPILPFEDVHSINDTWDYIEKVFIPGLYASNWYDNRTRLSWREKLTLSNRYALRVGSPRIRQLRIKENTCKIFSKFNGIIDHCRDNYNWIDDDTKDYGIGWAPIVNGTIGNSSSTMPEPDVTLRKTKYTCKHAWCYQNTLQTKSLPIMGTYTTYKGGGYAINLGRAVERSVSLIGSLRDENWIDQLTRAVFFEFTIYNPNANLFASATFILEFLSTGAAISYHTIDVFLLYNYLGSFGIIVLVFQIAFVLFLIYYIVAEILQVKEQRGAYFRKFWNWNDILIISLSIVAIAMYAMRTVFTNLAIKAAFESQLGEFVNFNTIAQWDMIYSCVTSCVVFCATLKFLKLLRFNNKISMLSMTLRLASRDLLGFSVTFAIIFVAFTQFSFLIFGSNLATYRNFYYAMSSVFRFALGQFELKEMQRANYPYGSIYFVLFIFIVIMGIISMFITILNEAFEKCKKELANKKNEYEFVEYFREKFESLRKTNKTRANKNKIEAVFYDQTKLGKMKDEIVDVSVKEAMNNNLKTIDHSQLFSASTKSFDASSWLAATGSKSSNSQTSSF